MARSRSPLTAVHGRLLGGRLLASRLGAGSGTGSEGRRREAYRKGREGVLVGQEELQVVRRLLVEKTSEVGSVAQLNGTLTPAGVRVVGGTRGQRIVEAERVLGLGCGRGRVVTGS